MIKDDLILLGLSIHDEHESEIAFNADTNFEELETVFLQNGWDLTFNGEVSKGVRQAAFKDSKFGGGNAVLHFKLGRVYYVTLNFSRNYFD